MNTGSVNESMSDGSLATFLEVAFEAAVAFDIQEHITYWNPAAEQMYGWTAQEALGKTPAELFWPVSTSREQKNRKQRLSKLKRGETLRGRRKAYRKDGSSLRVQYAIRAIFNRKGKLSGYLAVYRDISAQVQLPRQSKPGGAGASAAETLRASEERYRVVIDNALDAIIVTAPAEGGRVLSVNSAACHMFGYSQEEFIGLDRAAILDVSDPRLTAVLERRSQVGQVFATEVTYKRKDGTRFPGELSSALYQDENGEQRAVAIIRDITERKQIETQLKEVAEKYATLFDATSDGVSIHNLNSEILEVNDAYCHMSGYARAELIGMPVSALEAIETPGEIADHIRKVIAAGGHDRFESKHRRKDGSIFDVDITALYLGREDGRIAIFVRDITARKQAEAALRSSEQKLRRIFDSSPIDIAVIGLDGRFIDLNKAALTLHGFSSKDELIGKDCLSLVDPEYHARVAREWEKVLATGSVSNVELVQQTRDGQKINTLVSVTRLDNAAGEPEALLAMVLDITKRTRAEEQLERSRQKLDEIVTSIQDDFYVLDRDWIFVYANRQFTSKIGKEPKDFIGNNIWKMFPMHLGTSFEENLRAAMEKREIRRFEIPGKYTNAWYRMTAFPSAEGITVLGSDISKRKRAEQALQESEERLRQMIETAPVAIGFGDSTGRIFEANLAFYRLTGYTREEIEARQLGWDQLTAPEYAEIDRQIMATLEATGAAGPYEKEYIRKDGSRVPLLLTVSKFPGRDEHIAFIMDISARKRTEQALAQALQELYAHINNSPLAIVSFDAEFRLTEWSEGAERMFGWRAEEVLDKKITELHWVHEDDLRRVADLSADMLAGHTPSNVHTNRNYRKDGSIVECEWYNSALLDADGKLISVRSQVLDVTERNRTRQQIFESNQRLLALMNALPVGVSFSDDPTCQHVTGNPTVLAQLEMGSEDNLSASAPDNHTPGRQVQYFRDGKQLTGADLPLQRAVAENREIPPIELEIHLPSGRRWWASASGAPIRDQNGNVMGGVAVTQDITARKQAEDVLREQQKQLQLLNETLEQKVHEKTAEVHQLASDLIKAVQHERHRISHILHDDLQQRIYAIQMQLTLLHDEFQEKNKSAEQEVSDIEKQLAEVLAVTRHLSIDLSPPILRGEGLAHAISWLAAQMRQRYGLSIELQANGSFAVSDEALHVLLFNCVRELLFNVVKHAHAHQAVVTLQWADASLRIEVHDDGVGFSTGTLEQAEGELNGENGSRPSLGLSTIRHQLNLFGGRMEIQSEPGAGTRVTLIIPVVEGP